MKPSSSDSRKSPSLPARASKVCGQARERVELGLADVAEEPGADAQLQHVDEGDDQGEVGADVDSALVPEDAGHHLEPELLVAIAVEDVHVRERDLEAVERATRPGGTTTSEGERSLDVSLRWRAHEHVRGERAQAVGRSHVDLRH